MPCLGLIIINIILLGWGGGDLIILGQYCSCVCKPVLACRFNFSATLIVTFFLLIFIPRKCLCRYLCKWDCRNYFSCCKSLLQVPRRSALERRYCIVLFFPRFSLLFHVSLCGAKPELLLRRCSTSPASLLQRDVFLHNLDVAAN